MRWWRSLLEWRPWFSQRRREDELEREIRSHLDLEAEERQESGLTPGDARYAAQRAFGNTTLVKENTRATWPLIMFEQPLQDVRYALRGMRRNVGFGVMAVLSLALGIGATTAVFSILNAIVLRPLPVARPERLVMLQPELRGKRFALFNPLFEELREKQQSLSGMFAVSDEPYLKAALNHGVPVYLRGSLVSGNYFQVLGLSPAFGRLLTSDDDKARAASCAAVISYSFWTGALHANQDVLGQPVVVREKICTIVGIAPAGFVSHQPGYAPDIWIPIRLLTDPKLLASRSMAFFSGIVGRLRDGRTAQQAEAELTMLYQGMQPPEQPSPFPGEAPPKPRDFRIRAMPGAQGIDALRRQFTQPLALALAVVGVVLLIAAMNVANLLLARGVARSSELATRAALGAGRSRLLRLLATEGAVLAVLGGLAGLALAWSATPLLAKVVSLQYKWMALDIAPDARVLAAAGAATMLAIFLVGLLPALRLSGAELQTGMADAGRVAGTRSGQRLTRTLVAVQLALSLLLVTVAGLLLRTILHVMQVDPGFNISNVVLMDIRDTEPAARFGEIDSPAQKERRATLYRAVDQKLNSIPGVRSSSLSWLGLFGGNYVGLNLYEVNRPEDKRFTLVDYVSPRYFETIGMQITHGRGFSEADREGSLRVAIVNEAFIRDRLGIGQQAIGRRMVMIYADDRQPWTIIGVVRNAKYNDLREQKAEAMMWVPIAQAPFKAASISIRVQPGTDAQVVRAARAALAAASPYLMVREVTTLHAQVDRATGRERLLLYLASGFGGIALLLATVGVYGIFAYGVSRRRREIGVRLALGAQRGSVLRSVLYEALALATAATAVGIPLSLAAAHLLRSFLFGVTEYDVLTLLTAAVVLAATALVSAYAPARRASNVDPVVALRYE